MNEKTRFKEIVSILKESDLIGKKSSENLCLTISKLGPTFIKIGQIMSSRYDILPKEYCDELAKLRSNVKPMNFDEVEQILEEELGNTEEIFKEISKTSIGSASMAQVHRAKLITGEDVVIKVQRRNIYETMTMDVRLLKKAISLLHLNSIVKVTDLNAVIDEIYNVAKEEMNFELEARHLEEFRENNIDIAYVTVPKVYKNYVTKRVLVMEYIDGVSLNHKDKLIEQGYDLKEIGLKLSNNYIKQALDDGFFHADPHQDNIFICDGKIVFLDLGMMGRINARSKEKLNKAMKAIVKNDIVELEHALLSVSTTTKSINHTNLRAEIQNVLDKNVNEDIQNINVIEFSNSVSDILRKNNLKLDNNITLLMRGICVIEGTLEEITPNINLSIVLSNKLKENSFRELFSREMLINTGKNIAIGANSLIELPSELLNFVKDVNRGETKFDIEMANSDKQVNKLEKMLHQLVIGVLDAAVLLGASIVNNNVLRWIYLFFALIFTIWLFTQMLKDHFHNGY